MTRVTRQRPSASDFAHIYAPIVDELARVEAVLQNELTSKDPFVNELIQYGVRLQGKRLRPALVLLTAKAAGEVSEAHMVLGAVVEMIHTATLIHDDVLDEASLRRHVATVNARWDNEASVLLGDYLFTHSFYLASTLDGTYACQAIGRATNVVCEGELRQTANTGNYALSEEQYFSIIEAKTAELCACCCGLGAHFAGAAAEVEQGLSDFGRHLGIAFQIVDDLLDLEGDEATIGKSLGTDLKKGKPTLPMIYALAQAAPAEREDMLAILTSRDSEQQSLRMAWLDRFDALKYARNHARQYAARARENLAVLPASPARDVLDELTHLVTARSH